MDFRFMSTLPLCDFHCFKEVIDVLHNNSLSNYAYLLQLMMHAQSNLTIVSMVLRFCEMLSLANS